MYIKNIVSGVGHFLLKTDDYVPIDIELREYEVNLFYFRYISDYSLLELGVSPNDGVLTSIKLVMVPRISTGEWPVIPTARDNGLPVFDIGIFKMKTLFDINKPIKLFLEGNSCLISINAENAADNVSQTEGVIFGMAGGCLCWIVLPNVPDDKVNAIAECVGDGTGFHII